MKVDMQLKKTGDTFEAQTKIQVTSSRKFARKKILLLSGPEYS